MLFLPFWGFMKLLRAFNFDFGRFFCFKFLFEKSSIKTSGIVTELFFLFKKFVNAFTFALSSLNFFNFLFVLVFLFELFLENHSSWSDSENPSERFLWNWYNFLDLEDGILWLFCVSWTLINWSVVPYNE